MADLVWSRQPANSCEPQLRRTARCSRPTLLTFAKRASSSALLTVQEYPLIALGSHEVTDLALVAHARPCRWAATRRLPECRRVQRTWIGLPSQRRGDTRALLIVQKSPLIALGSHEMADLALVAHARLCRWAAARRLPERRHASRRMLCPVRPTHMHLCTCTYSHAPVHMLPYACAPMRAPIQMYPCTCTHAHVCLCACTYARAPLHVHPCICAPIHLCACAYACTLMHLHLCTCTHLARAPMHLCTCTYAHVPMYMHLCTCTYAHAPMHMHLCTYAHAPMHMHLCTCTYAHAPMHLHLYTCTYAHAPMHMHLCTCLRLLFPSLASCSSPPTHRCTRRATPTTTSASSRHARRPTSRRRDGS